MPTRLTHEEYLSRISSKGLRVEPLEQYINNSTNIRHRCLDCGYEWNPRPANVLNGNGCPKCSKLVQNKKATMTHSEFLQKVEPKLSKNIKIVGRFSGAKRKVLCTCMICGNNFETTAQRLYHIKSCRQCAHAEVEKKHLSMGLQNFQEWLSGQSEIVLLSEYHSMTEKVHLKNQTCGHEWWTIPYNIMKRHGCPKCANIANGNRCRKTHDEFIQELRAVNLLVEPLEEYRGADANIRCRCKLCGAEWQVRPANLLSGRGCPNCSVMSSGERTIYTYLKNRGIDMSVHHSFDDLLGVGGRPLSYDFYLPDYHLLIEFQGLQHFEPVDVFGGEEHFKIQQEHDARKAAYAQEHNYLFVTINYDEEQNICSILDSIFRFIKPVSRETVQVV